jgi:hypothetical protein
LGAVTAEPCDVDAERVVEGDMTVFSRVAAFGRKRRTPVAVVSTVPRLTRREAFTRTFGFPAPAAAAAFARTVVRRTVADGLVPGASLNSSIRSVGFFGSTVLVAPAEATPFVIGPDESLLPEGKKASRGFRLPFALLLWWLLPLFWPSAASDEAGRLPVGLAEVVRVADVTEADRIGGRATRILLGAVVLVMGGREGGAGGHVRGFPSLESC